VIEVARNLAGLEGANSSEFEADTPYPVIDLLPDQRRVADKGGTMRLGLDPCRLLKGSRAEQAYGDGLVFERHRHRYEVNNRFRRRLEDAGLVFSGTSPDGRLVEMIELPDHPWFVAGQFHPEFRSRPTRPHPLFRDFVGAATAFADARDRSAAAPTEASLAEVEAAQAEPVASRSRSGQAPTPSLSVPSDGAPAHRNGGERAPVTPTAATPPAPTPSRPDASPAVPRVPVAGANPRPEPAGAPATPPVEPPATVDLRSDGLADPVRHDDDPPVPAGPVAAGEPGRP
jgi:hypothetical protein